jgi:hypothetical protein
MMKSFALYVAMISSVLFFLCTNPPALNFSQVQDVTDSLITKHSPEQIRGTGVVSMKIDRRKFSGNTDVDWKKGLSFHADFYSPLGTVVASISGDSINGTFNYNGKFYMFNLHSTMDSLPFEWAKEFTFDEFAEMLTGNLSTVVKIFGPKPCLVHDSGNLSAANWNTNLKNYSFTTLIDRKKMSLQKVIFESTKNNWTMTFFNFKKGIAFSMLFKDGENNYFSLEYDYLKYLWGISQS